MKKKLGKAWAWTKRNVKLALSIVATVLLIVLGASWYSKNKKIRQLQHKLDVSRAKMRIQKLAGEYEVTVSKLNELREEDKKIDEEIAKVEDSLKDRLSTDMTVDEIIEKFKEIGIVPKENPNG